MQGLPTARKQVAKISRIIELRTENYTNGYDEIQHLIVGVAQEMRSASGVVTQVKRHSIMMQSQGNNDRQQVYEGEHDRLSALYKTAGSP